MWLVSCKQSSQSASLCSVCHRSVSHSLAGTWGDPDRREDSQWLEQWTPHPDHPEKDQWHHSQKQRDLSDQPSGETTQVISAGTRSRGHCHSFFPTGHDTNCKWDVSESFSTFSKLLLRCFGFMLKLPGSWVQNKNIFFQTYNNEILTVYCH